MAEDQTVIDWPQPRPDRLKGAIGSEIFRSPMIDPDPRLLDAIMQHESNGNPDATGAAGELGLMQISPALAKDYKLSPEQLRDPETNKAAGKFFLGQLLKKYDGDVERALQAYNGGPGHVDKGTVSPQAKGYAQRVMQTFANLVGPREASAADGEVDAPAWLAQANVSQDASKATGASPVSGEAWQKMLQKVGYGIAAKAQASQIAPAPEGESLGEHLGRAYRENIAAPATKFVEKGYRKIGEYLPANPLEIPGFSPPNRDIPHELAEMTVPQTATDVALAGVGFALPATRLGEAGAEGASILKRALSSRTGQIAATAGTGAAIGEVTGEGAKQGGIKGLAVGTLGQLARGTTGMLGRSTGKATLADSYSQDVAGAMKSMAPEALGKVKTAENVFDVLGREGGEATNVASQVLSKTKADINASLSPNQRFRMPIFEGVSDTGKMKYRIELMNFNEADNLLTAYGKKAYNMEAAAKDTETASYIRKLTRDAKLDLYKQLETAQPGAGTAYRKARKTFAATDTLSALAREPIFDLNTGQLSQPALSKQMQSGGYYARLLDAVDDPKEVDKFVSTIGRNYRGAAADVPSQPFTIRSSSVGMGHPRLHPHLGSTGKPVGQLPWFQNPGIGIPQFLSQGIVSEFQGDSKK